VITIGLGALILLLLLEDVRIIDLAPLPPPHISSHCSIRYMSPAGEAPVRSAPAPATSYQPATSSAPAAATRSAPPPQPAAAPAPSRQPPPAGNA
jgi:hypothetical protein